MDKPYYTDYVRFAMRYYSRHVNQTRFSNEVYESNWNACHNVLKVYLDKDRDMLIEVYGAFDTIGDNVYTVANKYQIDQNVIWRLMGEFERKVAIERGLWV